MEALEAENAAWVERHKLRHAEAAAKLNYTKKKVEEEAAKTHAASLQISKMGAPAIEAAEEEDEAGEDDDTATGLSPQQAMEAMQKHQTEMQAYYVQRDADMVAYMASEQQRLATLHQEMYAARMEYGSGAASPEQEAKVKALQSQISSPPPAAVPTAAPAAQVIKLKLPKTGTTSKVMDNKFGKGNKNKEAKGAHVTAASARVSGIKAAEDK